MNIEIISGSPRSESVTNRVAVFLHKKLAAETTHNIDLLDVRDYPLPLLQKVWKSADDAPKEWQPLAKRVFAADAFILVSPEYNGGYSPAMKNLLDHFPKQSRKPFGIATASPGAMGGMRAALALQHLTCALMGIPSPTMLLVPKLHEVFNEKNELSDATFQPAIDNFVKEFLWLAEKLTA